VKEVFTDEEIEALFNACKHDSKPYEYQLRDTLILALLIETGVRSQEIRTLTIDNVIFARGVNEDSYIKVIGKGQKEREIPIGNHARRTLQRYLLAGCYDFLCLVGHVQCERRQPFTQLASVLTEAADDSGMLPVDCYLARNTFCKCLSSK
jgi:site-specific recombinase XerD